MSFRTNDAGVRRNLISLEETRIYITSLDTLLIDCHFDSDFYRERNLTINFGLVIFDEGKNRVKAPHFISKINQYC